MSSLFPNSSTESCNTTLAVLGLQAIFFVGVIVWSLLSSDWVSGWRWEWLDLKLEIAALAAAHYVIIFVPLALLAGAAIVLVWLRPHAGWLFAMAVQCVVLFLSLEIYFIERADDIIDLPVLYLMMFGAVLIVIFLNSPEGRLLLVRSTSPREQAHGETRT